jgi:uncharacterized protein (UPF0333 family)
MAKKRGQSSMEYLVLMGFLAFVIVGIVGVGFYYSTTINDRIKSSQVANFANKITSTSDMVFYSGEPSKSTITVYLPDGVAELRIINNSLIISHWSSSGLNVIAYTSKVLMIEDQAYELTPFSGLKSIEIVANETHAIIREK